MKLLRSASFASVALDLPGLVLKRIIIGPAKVTLDYGLPGIPPAAVKVEQFDGADAGAQRVLQQWGEARSDEGARIVVAFREGQTVVRLSLADGATMGLPQDPFAHLGLTLERVRAALVPLREQTDEDLALPPGYLGEDLP